MELTPSGFTEALSSPVVFESLSWTVDGVCLHLSTLKVFRCDLYLILFFFVLFSPHYSNRLLFKNIHMYTPTTSTLRRLGQKCLDNLIYAHDLKIESLVRTCCLGSASGCGKKSLGECRKQAERSGEHRERRNGNMRSSGDQRRFPTVDLIQHLFLSNNYCCLRLAFG